MERNGSHRTFLISGYGVACTFSQSSQSTSFQTFPGLFTTPNPATFGRKQCRRKRPQNLHIETKSEIFRRRPVVDGSVEAPRNLEQIWVSIVSRCIKTPTKRVVLTRSGQKLHNVSSASSVQHGQSLQIRSFEQEDVVFVI